MSDSFQKAVPLDVAVQNTVANVGSSGGSTNVSGGASVPIKISEQVEKNTFAPISNENISVQNGKIESGNVEIQKDSEKIERRSITRNVKISEEKSSSESVVMEEERSQPSLRKIVREPVGDEKKIENNAVSLERIVHENKEISPIISKVVPVEGAKRSLENVVTEKVLEKQENISGVVEKNIVNESIKVVSQNPINSQTLENKVESVEKKSLESVAVKKDNVKNIVSQGKVEKKSDDLADTEKIIDHRDLMNLALEKGASDIHVSEENFIYLRIGGRLKPVDGVGKLTKIQTERIVYGIIGEKKKEKFLKQHDLDCSYEHDSGDNFRVNVFFKKKRLAMVSRIIPSQIKSMTDLKLPELCMEFVKNKQGLILVTGPTGSGKSTSMAAMLQWMNEHMDHHVVTIEDPIEFSFESEGCIFSQRELGEDTLSMSNALKAVLRQDPDVVVIGEMRDPETIAAALTISETGHLVFGTLHTSSAASTISRLVTAFPPSQHTQICERIAESLVGVVSQRLVPRISGGRVAIFETFVNTPAFSNMIRTGDTKQLNNSIQLGAKYGMISMERSAYDLVEKGIVEREDVEWLFEDDDD